jgi:hypothetical protein
MPDKIPQTISCTTNTDLQQMWRIGKASNEESGTMSVTFVGRSEAGLGFLQAHRLEFHGRPMAGCMPKQSKRRRETRVGEA